MNHLTDFRNMRLLLLPNVFVTLPAIRPPLPQVEEEGAKIQPFHTQDVAYITRVYQCAFFPR